MYFVRFLKIGSHFGKQFAVGNADVYGKAKLLPNLIFDKVCRICRRRVAVADRCIIHIALVYADLFNIRTNAGKKIHKHAAFFVIKGMVGRLDGKAGTFAHGINNGFSRDNSVFFGRNGFGENNTVPHFHITADNGGNFPKVGITSLF